MPTPALLQTKLILPRPGPDHVARPRLIARLQAGLARKLTCITAPAGFGKTTLAADWLAVAGRPVAWVSLEASDNDPARFWRYVLTACRTVDAQLGKTALGALRMSPQPAFDALLTDFLNDLAGLNQPLILALEDYHVLTAPEIHSSLAFLIDHLPPSLHLVLLTRSQPDLPLARWRARNELNELTTDDLRFSLSETESFLTQVLQSPPPAQVVSQLEQRTERWAAGLRLAALTLQNQTAQSQTQDALAAFSGSHPHVLAYLTSEALDTQPPDTQIFLLQTSFLERMTGALCNAITGRSDSAETLAMLAKANLFLQPLEEQQGQTWYRYHALFAEAMQLEARHRLSDSAILHIHAQASLWQEAQGALPNAVEEALAASQLDRAANLIDRLIEEDDFNELFTLRRWFERLPEPLQTQHPSLCFAYVLASLFISNPYQPATRATSEKWLTVVEQRWRAGGNEARLGELLAVRSLTAWWQNDYAQCFAYAREALELLPDDNLQWRSVALSSVGYEALLNGQPHTAQRLMIEARALSEAAGNIYAILPITQLLGEVALEQGELEEAAYHFQQVLERTQTETDMLDDQAAALWGLAVVAYEHDDLESASASARQALDLAQQRGHLPRQVNASLVLARISAARGDFSQAQKVLQPLATRLLQPSQRAEVQYWQARLAFQADDLSTVQSWQAMRNAAQPNASLKQQEREALLLARWHITQGQAQTATHDLEVWHANAQTQGRTPSETEALLVLALAYAAQSDLARSQAALSQALALGQSKGFRRLFLDEGESLQKIVQAALPTLTPPVLHAFTASLLPTGAPTASTPPTLSPLLEPLSPQELRVLRLLVAGLSNPEIARELVVSPNTIKTQLKSIYRKLNVATRDEAREVAQALKLI